MQSSHDPDRVGPYHSEPGEEPPGRLGTPWFGHKRVGWGFRPTTWQGWALTVIYFLLVWGAASALRLHHVALFIGALIAISVAYVVVVVATSRAR